MNTLVAGKRFVFMYALMSGWWRAQRLLTSAVLIQTFDYEAGEATTRHRL